MARTRVDPSGVHPETEGEREFAEAVASGGPKVEDVADGGKANDQNGSEPYNPAVSIDATHPNTGA